MTRGSRNAKRGAREMQQKTGEPYLRAMRASDPATFTLGTGDSAELQIDLGVLVDLSTGLPGTIHQVIKLDRHRAHLLVVGPSRVTVPILSRLKNTSGLDARFEVTPLRAGPLGAAVEYRNRTYSSMVEQGITIATSTCLVTVQNIQLLDPSRMDLVEGIIRSGRAAGLRLACTAESLVASQVGSVVWQECQVILSTQMSAQAMDLNLRVLGLHAEERAQVIKLMDGLTTYGWVIFDGNYRRVKVVQTPSLTFSEWQSVLEPGTKVTVISAGKAVYERGGVVSAPRTARELDLVEDDWRRGKRVRVWVDWEEDGPRILEYVDNLTIVTVSASKVEAET